MSISKRSAIHLGLTAALAASVFSFAGEASATAFDSGIPAGWTCTGNCGTLGANGVVTTSPEGGDYGWVSTAGGVSGNTLHLGSDTNGSTLTSSLFSANAGDNLQFFFDYVTSDGAGFADYAWAQLLDTSNTVVALLFTARTTPGGNSVPGFGMPLIAATITPATVSIVSGGPSWTPLGGSSGACWDVGCGFTGWVQSDYTIASAGNYKLQFGTANWLDTAYDSGMAFDGITVGGEPITPPTVPEPASLALLGIGLAGLGAMRRKQRA
jgi:hypothetical protein